MLVCPSISPSPWVFSEDRVCFQAKLNFKPRFKPRLFCWLCSCEMTFCNSQCGPAWREGAGLVCLVLVSFALSARSGRSLARFWCGFHDTASLPFSSGSLQGRRLASQPRSLLPLSEARIHCRSGIDLSKPWLWGGIRWNLLYPSRGSRKPNEGVQATPSNQSLMLSCTPEGQRSPWLGAEEGRRGRGQPARIGAAPAPIRGRIVDF